MQSIYKILLTGVTLAVAPQTYADTSCLERSQMVEQLATTFGELQTARGVQNSQAILEIFASKDGNWTAVITHINGMSCIVAAGKNWEQSTPLPGEKT